MKKTLGLLLFLCLCLCCASALAVQIKVPATAQDAYAKFPSKQVPFPTITAEKEPDGSVLFRIEGMHKLPLREKKRYEKGVFLHAPASMMTDGLGLLADRTEEPFGVLVKEEGSLPLITAGSSKIDSLSFRFNPQLQTAEMTCRPNKNTYFRLNQFGSVTHYSFKSGNHQIYIDYDDDGYPTEYSSTYKDYYTMHDATGALTSLIYQKGNVYCTYEDGVWRDGNDEICKQPPGFSAKNIPEFVLTPAESAERVAARNASVALCLPADPSQLTAESDLSLFAPLPVVTEQVNDQGGLRLTVTGLDAWGLITRQARMAEGNAIYQHDNPNLPAGTITVDFLPHETKAERLHVYVGSNYKDIDANLIWEERLGGWVFAYFRGPVDTYRFLLGSTPKLYEWKYERDGRIYAYDLRTGTRTEGYWVGARRVEHEYWNDQLVSTMVVEGDGYGTIRAFYDETGALTNLVIEGNPLYTYKNNQWTIKPYGEEATPCDPPSGFDLTPWLTAPAE